MKKIAVLYDHNDHQTVKFFVDVGNASTILPYLNRTKIRDEIRDILQLLKENGRNSELYKKCDVSDKAAKMFEMRFRRNGKNDRIYCQEVHTAQFRGIVMIELLEGKKTQEIPKRQKERINTMGGYIYEFQ